MNDRPRTARLAAAALLAGVLVLGVPLAVSALAARAPPGARTLAVALASPPSAESVPVLSATPADARATVATAPPAVEPSLRPPAAAPEHALAEDGEKEHYARFRALLAADRAALERAAPSILLGDAPVAERAGLLRALEDGGSPAATPMLELALLRSEPAGTSGPLQDFALRSLSRRAPADPAARAALRKVVWGPLESRDPALRRRAAGQLAAAATEDELAAGFPELSTEGDPLVVQAFRSARAERANQISGSPGTPRAPTTFTQ